MIKIVAEVHTDVYHTARHPLYCVRVSIEKNGDYVSAVQRVLNPEELYTSSIFNRIFDGIKDDLMREFERQDRLRSAQ